MADLDPPALRPLSQPVARIIEALTSRRKCQLGHDKLPPLRWWLVEIAYRGFHSDIAFYALGQLRVVAAFADGWAIMLASQPPFSSSMECTTQLQFLALAGLSLYGALRTGCLVHWAC
jgi:hypothetical protein